jgi:hypothetical protein
MLSTVGSGVRVLLFSRTRHLVLAGLLSLVGGGGLGLLVASASGQGSGEPLFQDNGPIVFNFVQVGSTSETKSVTISNAGEGELEITSAEVSASKDFSIVADGCIDTSLAAGQSCAVSLVFHPAAAGTRVGSLVIGDSHDTCKNYVNLAGSGTETKASSTVKAAACVVSGSTTTLPGKTVTSPGQTAVAVQAPTPPLPEVDTLQLVSPPRCVSGRHISMRLRTSKAESIVLARVYINGHLVETARSHDLSVVVADLPGKPLRRYRVQVVVGIAIGRTLGLTHYFATCSQRPRRSSSH